MSDRNLAPSAIRAAARALFVAHLPTVDAIARDPDAKPSTRLDAVRLLGDFGLGRADQSAVHIHAEGNVSLGVITLPALGSGRDPEEAAKALARTPASLPPGEVDGVSD